MPADEPPTLENRVSELERAFADFIRDKATLERLPRELGNADLWALDGLRKRVGDDSSGAVVYTGIVELPTGEHYDWQLGTSVDDLFEADWSDWAATLGALGHPVRLLLLRRVLAGTRTAAELAADEALGTTGQLYHHLRQLVSTGWLHSSARGRYSVPGERVVPLLVVLTGARS
ncbi:helix-turn-helix domain-containing protein [Actinoplanes sp. TFC3]|uniref:helix-turn-helix domain-containing protein n=1 Tax=Actinoplanes sp. TFC3 TaxID=1710355 RepID=UPI00082D98BF|nr:helix-turn-helix domain-containing protein [Actinoplanes sp. TFC3]